LDEGVRERTNRAALRIADSGCASDPQGSKIGGMRPAAGSVIGFDGPRFTPGEEKQT
jgi:hypothetical protein